MHRGVFLWILGIDFAPQGIQTIRIFGVKILFIFQEFVVDGREGGVECIIEWVLLKENQQFFLRG